MNTIFIKTFGCTLNKKDTENITFGFKTTTKIENISACKYILINTCGVKEQTETKVVNYLNKLKKLNINEKKIIITGCLVTINKNCLTKIFPNANYFEVKEQNKLKEFLNIKKIKNKNSKESKITEIIIISNGCLGKCSYCAVKFARGKLKSKSINSIIKDIKSKINQGTKEIYLTSQDTGCYGFDINTNIINLLKEIIKIEGDFKIRLGMGNPKYFHIFRKELIEIFKSEKMYLFLHIPIQSANNNILKKMNRPYDYNLIEKLLLYFKKNINNLNLSTDVIVGFPTETNKEFLDTINFIKKIKFDIVNISRYGERKNIEALKYKDILSRTKKERSRLTTKICKEISFENNKKYINKTRTILINEKGKNNSFIGVTKEYKTVVVFGNYKIGSKIKVKIIDCKNFYLIGKKVNLRNTI